VKPAKVPTQIVRVKDESVGNGIEARSFAGTALQAIDHRHGRVREHGRGDDAFVEQKKSRGITPFDRGHSKLRHTGQSLGHAASCEKNATSFRELEGELGERIPVRDVPPFGNLAFGDLHSAAPNLPRLSRRLPFIPVAQVVFGVRSSELLRRATSEAGLGRPLDPVVDPGSARERHLVEIRAQMRSGAGAGVDFEASGYASRG
jgi:hypothetical protein